MRRKRKIIVVLLLSIIASMLPVQINYAAATKVPKKIVLEENEKNIYTYQTVKLNIKRTVPANASRDVIWKSSNKRVAVVSTNGKVTGKKKGTTIITVRSKKNKEVSAKCKVKVIDFQQEEISGKKEYVAGTAAYFKKETKKYCVIHNYQELQMFQKKMQKIYKKNNVPGNIKAFNKSALGKKLNSYTKSYFKKNVLCVMEGSSESSGIGIEIDKLKMVQGVKGIVAAKLYVNKIYPAEEEEVTQDLCYQQYFLDIPKDKAEMIQSYKIVMR